MKDRTFKVLTCVAVLNFATYIGMDLALGGDALSGKIVNGHYYLNSHGTYSEVDRTVFILSACQTASAFLGMFVLVATLQSRKRKD